MTVSITVGRVAEYIPIGAVAGALRNVPSGMTISSGRKHPSFAGSSGAVRILKAILAAGQAPP